MSITESDRVIIDTRTPDEYAVGHLEGARNIDFYANDFDEQLSSLDRETPYAIYCRSGNRSAQTLRKMQSLGFKDVVELEGGIVAWEEDGKGLCTKC